MNHIKYLNPQTGEVKRIRIMQPSMQKFANIRAMPFKERMMTRHRPTMAQADALMGRMGFVRCGLRWGSRTTRRLLEVQKMKNRIADVVALTAR